MIKNYIFILFILISILSPCFGQVIINGQITTKENKAQSQINILVYNKESSTLIAYDVSDEEGRFTINIHSESDSLVLIISSIHFANKIKRIANRTQRLDFTLTPDTKDLQEIEVRAKPIEKRGDTISFLVGSFVRQEDRSIEDVLRRMPGIEVEEGGRIIYQGMPIQNLYVDGLDLMDGKYVVVSENLPQTSVTSVEVLENHQPLRILENKVSSSQASINLKLSKGITTTGTANLGVGYSPLLRDINITPMFFSKKIQALASYQSNNTGSDVSKQLSDYSLDDISNSINKPSNQPSLINIEGAGNPELRENRYLDNNINLANINTLVKLKNDFTLRANIFYINDYQQQKKSVNTKLFNPTDTIEYNELISNHFFNNRINSTFTLNKNTKKYYFDNKLKFNTNWDKSRGMISKADSITEQSLSSPFLTLKNDLEIIREIGKHLVNIDSYISYDNSPLELSITPGQFSEVLNHASEYEKTKQFTQLNRFFTQNSASLIFKWKRFTITPRAGFFFREQNLNSHILIDHSGFESELGQAFKNNLNSKHTRIYASSEMEYKYHKLIIKTSLPLHWNSMKLTERSTNEGQKTERLFFDPQLSIDYKINGYWRSRIGLRITNRLGDMDKVHYNYLLENYRTLSKNDAPISETTTYGIFSYLSYRNPINSFFNTLTYGFNIIDNNLIYSNITKSDGSTLIQAYHKANTIYSHSLNFKTSKYISKLKSSLRLHFAFNYNKGQSLLNTELFETENTLYLIKPSIYIRITKWLNAEYSLEKQLITGSIDHLNKNSISSDRHRMNIFIYPYQNNTIRITSEYYLTRSKTNLFFDLSYKYSIVKKRIDLELQWTNILNNKTYTNYQVSTFNVWESTYVLRPSQFMVSIKFSF